MDLIHAIKERRSINFFDPSRKVPEETLRELIGLANLSPSSFDLQPWKVIAVRDAARKKVLRQCAFGQPKVEEASAVLIIVADPGGVEQNIGKVLDSWQELGYMKPDMRQTYMDMVKKLYCDADSLRRKIFAVKNASLFAMGLMISARGLGLETHAMDGFDEECVKKEFGITTDKIVPMLIAVGYLKQGITLLPRAFRRDLNDFVQFE